MAVLNLRACCVQAAVIIIPSYEGRSRTHTFLVHVLTVVRLMRVLRLPRLLQVLSTAAQACPSLHSASNISSGVIVKICPPCAMDLEQPRLV